MADEMAEKSRYERFVERYAAGEVPWDDTLPPPELMALVDEMEPGRALDLGCGYGRTSIYLAHHGWEVDGVDFVPQAIEGAKARAAEAGVSAHTHFHVAPVTDLHFLQRPYDLAVDVGCLHALTPEEQVAYRDELLRLLPPGAQYVLFIRLSDEEDTEVESGPPGVPLTAVRALFAQGFALERFVSGTTEMNEQTAWRSGWFWYRRI